MALPGDNLPWYHKPKGIAAATGIAVLIVLTLSASMIIRGWYGGASSLFGGDSVVDQQRSPDGEHTAWVIVAESSRADESETLVVLSKEDQNPKTDDHGNVMDPVFRCPKAKMEVSISWQDRRTLLIPALADPGVAGTVVHNKWDGVDVKFRSRTSGE